MHPWNEACLDLQLDELSLQISERWAKHIHDSYLLNELFLADLFLRCDNKNLLQANKQITAPEDQAFQSLQSTLQIQPPRFSCEEKANL